MNPKKDRSARRVRPDHPVRQDFEFREFTWKFFNVITGRQEAKTIIRYCATRSDGATVYRDTPADVHHRLAMAKSSRQLREFNAREKAEKKGGGR